MPPAGESVRSSHRGDDHGRDHDAEAGERDKEENRAALRLPRDCAYRAPSRPTATTRERDQEDAETENDEEQDEQERVHSGENLPIRAAPGAPDRIRVPPQTSSTGLRGAHPGPSSRLSTTLAPHPRSHNDAGIRGAEPPHSSRAAHRRRPDPKLWTAGANSRNSPSVAAAARPPWAPSPRPVAAAWTRRSASSTTRAS